MCRLYANTFHIKYLYITHSRHQRFWYYVGPRTVSPHGHWGTTVCVYLGAHVCSPMSQKEMFACFLWQRRNPGLWVLWLTLPKLGDCIGWLLTQESWISSASFLHICWPLVGLMTSWPTCFLRAPPQAVSGGKVAVGFLRWQPILFSKFSLLGFFF